MRASVLYRAAACAVAIVTNFTTPARAAIPPYALVGSYALPSGEWDVVPAGPWAGRLIAMQGATVVLQDASDPGVYAPIGSVGAGTVAPFGASFVRVSPAGDRLALGDNFFPGTQRVHFLDIAALTTAGPTPTTSTLTPNYQGVWQDNSTLYVAGGQDFSTRTVVSRVSADALTSTEVIDNIGDASGGVSIFGGQLFAGVGFDFAGPPGTTGQVRAFSLATLGAAVGPVDFSAGALAADVLSASPLDFDPFGHLLAGGGDSGTPGESGYAAVEDLVTSARLMLAPAGAQFYGVRFNAVTNQLLVSDPFGTGLMYVYAVPTPGVTIAYLMGVGVLARRRRRHV